MTDASLTSLLPDVRSSPSRSLPPAAPAPATGRSGAATRPATWLADETGLPDDVRRRASSSAAPTRSTSTTTKNVKWVAKLGSQSYGNPTVADGRVYVGTNNDSPRDPRFKGDRSVRLLPRREDRRAALAAQRPEARHRQGQRLGVPRHLLLAGGRRRPGLRRHQPLRGHLPRRQRHGQRQRRALPGRGAVRGAARRASRWSVKADRRRHHLESQHDRRVRRLPAQHHRAARCWSSATSSGSRPRTASTTATSRRRPPTRRA